MPGEPRQKTMTTTNPPNQPPTSGQTGQSAPANTMLAKQADLQADMAALREMLQ
jgi:hypothetical protein